MSSEIQKAVAGEMSRVRNKSRDHLVDMQFIRKCVAFHNRRCGHGNGFVTTEPKFVYLKSPGLKFMNYFTDLKNPLLKSFGSYKVEWVKW